MDLLTIDLLQHYLKIGKSSLYKLIKHRSDFPPPVWVGERRRYSKDAVNLWLYKQKDSPKNPPPADIDLLDLASALDVLKVSYATFHRLMKEDKTFPEPFIIAGKRLFDKLDLTNWLARKGLRNEG